MNICRNVCWSHLIGASREFIKSKEIGSIAECAWLNYFSETEFNDLSKEDDGGCMLKDERLDVRQEEKIMEVQQKNIYRYILPSELMDGLG